MDLKTLLMDPAIASDPEKVALLQNIVGLQNAMRDITLTRFDRANPFIEDITDWKERGERLFGKGKNITVYNSCTVVGKVEVGENTWIGPYTALDGTAGLKIGKGCSISSGVNIVSHDSVKWALSGGKNPYEYGPIEIGDFCFIGTGAFITRGVKIGKHCLVGAGAVVTKDIPDFSIALGVPAIVRGKVVVNGENVELIFHS
ncbi:MAG: acyltransferase [Bacteroidetes bacterium]|nr:acyltransferase [Bacteroidota bacterium]